MRATEILKKINLIEVNTAESGNEVVFEYIDGTYIKAFAKNKSDNLQFALDTCLRKTISVFYRENNINYDNTTWFVDDLAELKELVKVKFTI